MDKPTAVVSIEALEFVTNEVNAVHALCDRVLIPRKVEGESLSMAQRVATLECLYRDMVRRLGMTLPYSSH